MKQGELPGQFFLEYFTDTSCRKRKGSIDLDQVEQVTERRVLEFLNFIYNFLKVDAGLRLDRQSIKFQHMFDMKTPQRTYYMAADSEQEMRDWVMMICQVCNLQETEEKSGTSSDTVQCNGSSSIDIIRLSNFHAKLMNPFSDHNVSPGGDFEVEEVTPNDNSVSTDTITSNVYDPSTLVNRFDQLTTVNEYENDNVVTYRQSESIKRSTLMSSENQNNNSDGLNYSNLPPLGTMERKPTTLLKSTGTVKKIPENLKLRSDDKLNNNSGVEETTLYRASGPYIPLSDCFSGSPVLFVSVKPLTLEFC